MVNANLNVDPGLRRIHNDRDRGFSAAVVVPLGPKSLIFVSGEVGRDPSGAIVSGDFEAEARQCFENIRRALQRAGAGFSDVVRITAYLTDLSLYPVYSKVRTETFGADWPASATVGVAGLLLGAKLEVDAVAVVAAGPQAESASSLALQGGEE
jgi:enamine deaminase RidA (YjgF/YER057c/UK114 family)